VLIREVEGRSNDSKSNTGAGVSRYSQQFLIGPQVGSGRQIFVLSPIGTISSE